MSVTRSRSIATTRFGVPSATTIGPLCTSPTRRGLSGITTLGEGEYQRSEMIIQQLLVEAGFETSHGMVSVDAHGVEAPADWATLRSPENYTGYGRTENFA